VRANRATKVASASLDGVSRPRHGCGTPMRRPAAIGVKFFALRRVPADVGRTHRSALLYPDPDAAP